MDKLTDPREMRKRMHEYVRYGFGDETLEGERRGPHHYSTARPLMNAVFTAGHVAGWSGEDVMTALAYHALLRVEELGGMISLDEALRTMPPSL